MFIRGVYYEFIAIPCGHRYSMPLGLFFGDSPVFRVYAGADLYKILKLNVSRLLLLSPVDPLSFYYSLNHSFESSLEWGVDGCPSLNSMLGAWYSCTPRLVGESMEFDIYECSSFTYLTGAPPPYTRVMGCFIELLILLTKARAGVLEDSFLEYAKWLRWCIERASRGDERYVRVVELILQELRGFGPKS